MVCTLCVAIAHGLIAVHGYHTSFSSPHGQHSLAARVYSWQTRVAARVCCELLACLHACGCASCLLSFAPVGARTSPQTNTRNGRHQLGCGAAAPMLRVPGSGYPGLSCAATSATPRNLTVPGPTNAGISFLLHTQARNPPEQQLRPQGLSDVNPAPATAVTLHGFSLIPDIRITF